MPDLDLTELPQIDPNHPSSLLDPMDLHALVFSGLEPTEFTALDFTAAQVQEARTPDGRTLLVLMLPVDGVFKRPSRLLQGNGREQSALHGAMPMAPRVHLVAALDRLTPEARAQVEAAVAQRNAQIRAAMDSQRLDHALVSLGVVVEPDEPEVH